MHADEVDVPAPLVRALLADQFPDWAALPLARVPSAGTDNALFRLGTDMAVRLPRIGWAVGQTEKDLTWLPRLAPRLPLAVPEPIGVGEPAAGYPWSWGVYRWLPGSEARLSRLADPVATARELADFLHALRSVDATGGPAGTSRGGPLSVRDKGTRECIAAVADEIDVDAVTAVWDEAVAAPPWDGPPVWLHGDLTPGNLLVSGGKLSAVIDFACLGTGDPAPDLQVAWNLFAGESRAAFRAAVDADPAMWARARGFALSVALNQLPYYRDTNPALVALSRHVIGEVVTDHVPGRAEALPANAYTDAMTGVVNREAG
ncbi:MAG TPA: aminoglycoside phosphotransferase family protein [Pseudonocardiaceae bacterium]|jgi:aminoglycoside phosphotransferase (APT) family kinase protein|nr:aminoglycoside phosphotransferase family protein [Pseudonocardiaceae bacterium]